MYQTNEEILEAYPVHVYLDDYLGVDNTEMVNKLELGDHSLLDAFLCAFEEEDREEALNKPGMAMPSTCSPCNKDLAVGSDYLQFQLDAGAYGEGYEDDENLYSMIAEPDSFFTPRIKTISVRHL